MAACILSRRYYLMQLLLHILSWWGAKQHHFSPISPPSLRGVWLTERKAEIIRSPWNVSRAAFLSCSWQTSGLSAQVSPSEVHGDKSHGKLDSQTQILIDHGGCAFPKHFIKHCCLHLTHDSSLTKQMPLLSILLLRSLQRKEPLCWLLPTEIIGVWGH